MSLCWCGSPEAAMPGRDIITPPYSHLCGGRRPACAANGTAGALASLDRLPTAFIPTTERPDFIPGRGALWAGRCGSTPDKRPRPRSKIYPRPHGHHEGECEVF